MIEISGCGTALVTPFNKKLEVDYKVFRMLVRRQIKSGIHFLVPLGTTGETPCLEDDEKLQLLEITSEEAGGRIPVIAGAGSNSTKHTIKTVRMLSKAGADAFLIVTPYYNKPTQDGMFNHFKAVAESTDRPVVMYNVPGRTSVNMSAETCLRLAEIENIVATKEASGNYSQISEIIRNAPGGFTVLSGNDDETLSLVATGAKGVVSVASNVAPKQMSDYLNVLLAGDIDEAGRIHHILTPLFNDCFIESNPIPAKAALCKLGLIENYLRPPLYSATEKTLSSMEKTLKDLNIE